MALPPYPRRYVASVNIQGQPLRRVGVIEHQGQFWLVPEWAIHNDHAAPTRMIPLDKLRAKDQRHVARRQADFSIQWPIPASLLLGEPSPSEIAQYGVLINPPVRFQKPPAAP
jgi:hypothetical protein